MLVARAPIDVVALDWPEELSGMLALRDGRAVIGLNRGHSAGRRHFSFWHEAGHYLLHRRLLARGPMACAAPLGAPSVLARLEREADRFAVGVLMPSQWVTRAWTETPEVEAMARRFRVTRLAMLRRLRELRLA